MLVDEIQELREELRLLKQTLHRTICVGEVVEVDEELHRVRVKLPDRDNVVTGFLPVLVPFAHQRYTYSLPKVGDTVLCVFLPHGLEDGFVVGAFYHRREKPPLVGEEKVYGRFVDGAEVEYDEGTSRFRVETPGEVALKADVIVEEARTVQINGDVVISGNLFVSGNIQQI